MIQHRLMVAAQLELIAQLALDLLTQTVERHAADEIRRKLAGALLGPDDLGDGFALGLEGSLR
jgi:hypothetical protein